MTKKTLYKRLMPSLVASSFLILAACQGSSQDVNSQIAKVTNTANDGVLAQTKVSEELKSLQLDPTTLEAYTTGLQPIFEKLKSDSSSSWAQLFKIKNWYMGPSSAAKQFPAAITGSLFMGTNDYVIQQSQGDVFIDKDLFAKLKLEDQKRDLLTQYFSSIYSLRAITDEDLCTHMKKTFEVECESKESLVDESEELAGAKATPKEKVKKGVSTPTLVAADHARIKKVVDQVLAEADKVVADDVLKLMKENGFNIKFFDFDLVDSEEAEKTEAPVQEESEAATEEATASGKEVTKAMFHALIGQIQKASTEQLKCVFPSVSQTEAIDCRIELVDKSMGNQQVGKMGVTLVADGKKISNTSIVTASTETVPYGAYVDSASKLHLAVFQYYSEKLTAPKEGDRYRSLYAIAKKSVVNGVEGLELVSLVSVPGIVTEVEGTKCTGKADIGTELENLPFVVNTTDALINSSIVGSLKPIAPCW